MYGCRSYFLQVQFSKLVAVAQRIPKLKTFQKHIKVNSAGRDTFKFNMPQHINCLYTLPVVLNTSIKFI